MPLAPAAHRRLLKELLRLGSDPQPEDLFRIELDEGDVLGGSAVWIRGPEGSPYAGGYFRIAIDWLHSEYPAKPPSAKFATQGEPP